MFSGHYEEWRKSRMNGIDKYIKEDFFKGKKLLELGCGYGDLGNEFFKKGCKEVTCSYAREEYLNQVREKYSQLKTMVFDCDKDKLETSYDIILHWGVLYHLKNVNNHLKNVCDNCDYLLLETEVCDTDDIVNINVPESGYDQSFNGSGSRPSPKLIEMNLEENGFEYKMIMDEILNSGFHRYDWKPSNNNGYSHGLRRFWICWRKGKKTPLKKDI